MFPFEVNPEWYENYWLREQPRRYRPSLGGQLTGFAVVVALVVGGGALLSRYHVSQDDRGYQDWEQE
jgi:hypothetical protein